ncbi:winged helix DNA-binding protein [Salinibacterium sp. SYSU T00001]|uniref:MarR family winged helix-turn-helix transcriptional regulator n=1 Tax=Homoserinimonas sedimenticola TaxID=2986805 RepID=UPI002236A32F|nr:MarR family transcriptional regulator [Salinibacterium sedimenticola]MCW4386202.1 winged helix DNA-binding protein [Salinibacterium sedimenticola]
MHSSLWHEHVSSEITSVAYCVLWCLNRHGEMGQRDLLHRAQIDKSSLADLLRRLEDQGLVTTRRDEHDGRRKVVSLSEEGRRIHDDLLEAATRVNDIMVDGLADDEVEKFDETLVKLLESDVAQAVE